MSKEEESTQEIDVEALRDSLAAARAGESPNATDATSDRETARTSRSELGLSAAGDNDNDDNERTVMSRAPTYAASVSKSTRPKRQGRQQAPERDAPSSSITHVDAAEAARQQSLGTDAHAHAHPHHSYAHSHDAAPEPIEPFETFDNPLPSFASESSPPPSEPVHMDDNDNVDLADVNDVADDEVDDLARAPNDPAPSLIGTMPGYDVAQALRAMMGDVPDTYERAYREPEPASLDNATPFVVPTGYRRDREDSGLPSSPNEPTSPPTDEHDVHEDHASIQDLDDGDTQTRLPGDPPSPLTTRHSNDPEHVHQHEHEHEHEHELELGGRKDDDEEEALPAFTLDEDPESQQQWPAAAPVAPWGQETLTAAAGSSSSSSSSPSNQGSAAPPPATRRVFGPMGPMGADAPDHTAITRAAPGVSEAMSLRSESSESTAITHAAGIGGFPTPAVPWEVAKAVAAETTAVFKGPVPSMALPSMREPRSGEEDPNARREEEEQEEEDRENIPLRAPSPMMGDPLRENWDFNEPSSNFPVAKKVAVPPQSSPSFAAVDSTELETIDPAAIAPPPAASFATAAASSLQASPIPNAGALPNADLMSDRTLDPRGVSFPQTLANANAHRSAPPAPIDPIHAFDSLDPLDRLDAMNAREADGALPRFTLASIPEMQEQGPIPEVASLELLEGEIVEEEQTAARTPTLDPITPNVLDAGSPFAPTPTATAAVLSPSSPDLGSRARSSSPSMPSVDIRISSPGMDIAKPDPDPFDLLAQSQEEPTSAGTSAPSSLDMALDAGLGHPAPNEAERMSEVIEELVPEEILDDDDIEPKTEGAPAPTPNLTSRPPPASITIRPVVTAKAAASPPTTSTEAADAAEEQELFQEGRWGPLIALYRQRLATTDGPNKKAAILLKIASAYENGLEDLSEAYTATLDAFELAPGNEDVVAQVDRIGKVTQRMGELADYVKKRLVPGAPDDKRVLFLGHLVYWYERVLSRGKDVSPLVSDIERHDKVHPVVLKRAAQIAAMNGDTKTQREHLLRALERTSRREEKVQLHLALASAYAGTPEAVKNYETAFALDPTSIVALQGLKRLGKEKEQYAQIQWALERQAEVAPTESEKIDALLELAELQESKFLKREAAADLYEQVLTIEPSQPAALKALERCYHALRDWPKLSRVLAIRSEHTFDKKSKVELLELAAEVHESKLGDPAGAVEAYRNLLVVEPKHRRALSDLARLYEKLSDWANVATYKARLAELAPTKRLSSQELVKLGDFLNQPDRDPLAAKLQYETAVSVDPTNAAGWEALQRFAAEAGDIHRVIECLEQRKDHTDVPRQRAVVLVELANVHLTQGDEGSATECFEAAIRADSSNEAAAVAMLDAYTAEERWAEAAPLCELLVNAAIRDRDGEALFLRLRLATRIAAALGDADRSITSAVAALDARPKDPGAQADLIAVCSQSPGSLERVRPHIMRVAENAEALSADLLVRLATLLRELNELDSAATILEQARTLDPSSTDITKELSDVYLLQLDFPRACKLKIDMARNTEVVDVRFDLLVEAGEIWARRADELEKAASIFEEARGLKPLDPWLLQTLSWLYGELAEWGLLTGVLEDLAQVTEAPAEKMKHLITMAEVVRDRIGDRVRASDLFDQVIDIDKKRLDVFEEVVRALTEEKNWERLERSYRKMIARVKDDDEPQLQFLLFHQLGLIYRDRLGDASRAYDALDAASRLQPENAEVRKIVTELLVVTDNLDNAVARIRDDIDRDPHDAQLYAELYELFLRQLFFDKAWCAVNVLARLREPSPEQRRFHEDYAPMPLDRVPGQIVEQAWRSHIFHPDLDTSLTSLFAVMTPAVARMRFGQLRPEQRVGRPFTPTHSRMHDAIRLTFNNASEILAVAPPELLLGDLKAVSPFAPALAPFGAILVSGAAVEAQADSLIYMVGKRLAEQRPELSARAFLTVPDLVSLLATATRVSRQEVAKDPSAAALDASFSAILTPQERESIRKIILQATSDGTPLDVKRWSQAADLSSMRAGLLLAGDVEPARNSIGAEVVAPQDLTPREKIGELFRFATSDLYSDLRGAIGVAVQS